MLDIQKFYLKKLILYYILYNISLCSNAIQLQPGQKFCKVGAFETRISRNSLSSS